MGNPVHQITHAATLLKGNASLEQHKKLYDGRRGFVASVPAFVLFGAVLVASGVALVSAATGAELPNNATKTYTSANDAVSPIDGVAKPTLATVQDSAGVSRNVWPLDVPRNVVFNVTHASSIVAMTLVVTGLDYYNQLQTESLAVTATGTTKTANGKKAFKSIISYAITAATDATGNTANVGWGNVLGLPYRVDAAERVLPLGNGIVDVSGTVTKADDSAVTATTGDVRGTFAPNSAPDSTKKYAAVIFPTDDSVAQPLGLFGNVPA